MIIVLIIALCIADSLAYKDKVDENEKLKDEGILRSPAETTLSTFRADVPRLRIGHSETYFNILSDSGKTGIDLLDNAGLIVWIENGHLKLSTRIYNEDGKLVAEITGNEWMTVPDSRWDRNFNDHALEVRDAKGDVVLQVIIMDDYIQLAAKGYTSKGEGFAIGSGIFTEQDAEDIAQRWLSNHDPTHSEPMLDFYAQIGSPVGVLGHDPSNLTIEPIFRYPRGNHLGELIQ